MPFGIHSKSEREARKLAKLQQESQRRQQLIDAGLFEEKVDRFGLVEVKVDGKTFLKHPVTGALVPMSSGFRPMMKIADHLMPRAPGGQLGGRYRVHVSTPSGSWTTTTGNDYNSLPQQQAAGSWLSPDYSYSTSDGGHGHHHGSSSHGGHCSYDGGSSTSYSGGDSSYSSSGGDSGCSSSGGDSGSSSSC